MGSADSPPAIPSFSQIKPTRFHAWLVLAFLAAHAGLLFWSATTNSVTCDEYANLPAGLAHWKTGDRSIYCLSPPLLRMWAALPLLSRVQVLPKTETLASIRNAARAAAAAGAVVLPPVEPFSAVPVGAKHWNYGGYFQDFNSAHYQEMFVLARLMTILISCVAAWIVYRWAGEIFGPRAGLVACGLYCLCPNMAAHGSLVTTEVGTTTAMLAACWLWYRFCNKPSLVAALLAAGAVATAHLCKFTALLLWPMMAGLIFMARKRVPGKAALGAFTLAILVTLLLVNLVYRFDGFGSSLRSYRFASRTMSRLSALPSMPVPLPRDYVVGFDAQKAELEQGSPCSLLGEIYLGTRWYYYPVIFACKLPISIWAAVLLAVVTVTRESKARRHSGERALVLCVGVVLLGMGFLAEINMGLRYVLPALPLLYILLARSWQQMSRQRIILATIILGGLAAENLSAAPRYLTFNNILAGGPSQGWRIASETFDWGQGLIDLRKWVVDFRAPKLSLAYFGRVDPAVYGIGYRLLPEQELLEHVAVSAYFLDGLWYMLPSPTGPTARFRVPFYQELQGVRPLAVVGSTIFIYRREDFLAAKRRFEAKTGAPAQYYF